MSLITPPAMRVYRQLGEVGMVWSLQSVKDLEDPLLLMGHLAMFLTQFNMAQVYLFPLLKGSNIQRFSEMPLLAMLLP